MKDYSNTIVRKVRAFFIEGGKGTAKELGFMFGSQDIRKTISNLRKIGWHIEDMILDSSRVKLYWLNPEQAAQFRQLRKQSSSNTNDNEK